MREQEIGKTGYFIRDDGTVRLKRGKITRGCKTRSGYRQVTMYINKKLTSRFVHILGAKAFVQNPRPDVFNRVDHIDHDRDHNECTNLRWVDEELNKAHQKGKCVSYEGHKHRPWCSRPYKMRSFFFATKEEALECSRIRKAEKFEKMYREKLNSEPRVKSVGVQTEG